MTLRSQYMDIIYIYLFLIVLYCWGCQLSFNMLTISQLFIKKKKEVQPGNVKDEVIFIQKFKESKAIYKQQLKIESRRVVNDIHNEVPKKSTREVTLINRNIGQRKYPQSHRDMVSIREQMKEFKYNNGLFNSDIIDPDSKYLPVSRRKNDVLFVSARDFGKPESIRNIRNFEIQKYNDSNRNLDNRPVEIIEELTDPSGTDDEKNVDDYYNFNIIEEEEDDNIDSFIKEKKPRVRKHKYINQMKNKIDDSKFLLEGLGRKESFKSEFYRTPRNDVNRINQDDFLKYSTKEDLNSIQEKTSNIPKINPKSENSKAIPSKRLSIEKSFKFDFETEDENDHEIKPKMSESIRKLQNNIKMEFLEDIKFGSSIFRKEGSAIDPPQNENNQSQNNKNDSENPNLEFSLLTSALLKKKTMPQNEKDLINLELSDNQI